MISIYRYKNIYIHPINSLQIHILKNSRSGSYGRAVEGSLREQFSFKTQLVRSSFRHKRFYQTVWKDLWF